MKREEVIKAIETIKASGKYDRYYMDVKRRSGSGYESCQWVSAPHEYAEDALRIGSLYVAEIEYESILEIRTFFAAFMIQKLGIREQHGRGQIIMLAHIHACIALELLLNPSVDHSELYENFEYLEWWLTNQRSRYRLSRTRLVYP